jgi:hypothetical protein
LPRFSCSRGRRSRLRASRDTQRRFQSALCPGQRFGSLEYEVARTFIPLFPRRNGVRCNDRRHHVCLVRHEHLSVRRSGTKLFNGERSTKHPERRPFWWSLCRYVLFHCMLPHQREQLLTLPCMRTAVVQEVSFCTFPGTKLTRRIKMTPSVVILVRRMNNRTLKWVATIPTPLRLHLNLKVSRSLIKGCHR